jgi:hypothetical protein
MPALFGSGIPIADRQYGSAAAGDGSIDQRRGVAAFARCCGKSGTSV